MSPSAVAVFVLSAFVALLIAQAAFAGDSLSPEEIATLPPDDVAAVRANCLRKHRPEFDYVKYCEDQNLKALKELIERGSIKVQR